jgi:hypothetical protein
MTVMLAPEWTETPFAGEPMTTLCAEATARREATAEMILNMARGRGDASGEGEEMRSAATGMRRMG